MLNRANRKLTTIADGGTMLILDDGSSWLIEPDDCQRAKGWASGVRVSILPSGEPEQVIRNSENGEQVRVVYTGQR